MSTLNRRGVLTAAVGIAATATVSSLPVIAGGTPTAATLHPNASVEQWETSKHATLALRTIENISHWCKFANEKAAQMALIAGLIGAKVDFEESGVEDDKYWKEVHIVRIIPPGSK